MAKHPPRDELPIHLKDLFDLFERCGIPPLSLRIGDQYGVEAYPPFGGHVIIMHHEVDGFSISCTDPEMDIEMWDPEGVKILMSLFLNER